MGFSDNRRLIDCGLVLLIRMGRRPLELRPVTTGTMGRPLHYLFYRTVLWQKGRGDRDPVFGAVLGVATLVNLNAVAVLVILSNTWHIRLLDWLENAPARVQRGVLIGFAIASIVALYLWLASPVRYRGIMDEYRCESDEAHRRGTVLCVAYLVVSALLLVGAFLSRNPS